jgi:hypothetical protein
MTLMAPVVSNNNREILHRTSTKVMVKGRTTGLMVTDYLLEKEDIEVHSKICEEGYLPIQVWDPLITMKTLLRTFTESMAFPRHLKLSIIR